MRKALRPLLHMDLGMVAPREDEGDPTNRQGAVGEPLMVAVAAEVAVEQFGQLKLLRQADKQGDVIDTFVYHAGGWCHPVIMVPRRCRGSASPWKTRHSRRKMRGKLYKCSAN